MKSFIEVKSSFSNNAKIAEIVRKIMNKISNPKHNEIKQSNAKLNDG